LTPTALCNLLQEAAAHHADALGVSPHHLSVRGVTWVVARLWVVLERVPRLQETLEVETWPAGGRGPFARRDFLLRCPDGNGDRRRGDGEEIGRATSDWLLLDLVSRQAVERPPEIRALDLGRPPALADRMPRPVVPRRPTFERRFTVRWSDLDLNRHANNARYAEWAVETLPRRQLTGHRLAQLVLLYRRETDYGDTVLAAAGEEVSEVVAAESDTERSTGSADAGERRFHHRLCRASDGQETALALTVWRPQLTAPR
jgi:acyl-ACP thioesterase